MVVRKEKITLRQYPRRVVIWSESTGNQDDYQIAAVEFQDDVERTFFKLGKVPERADVTEEYQR